MIALLYLVKASIVVSTTALALALVGRRASASSRHLLCTLGICGLLVLPILTWVLPGWSPVRLPAFPESADQSLVASVSFDVDGRHVTSPADRLRAEGASASLAIASAETEAGHHVTSPAKAGHYVTGPAEAGHYITTQLVSSQAFWFLLYASGVLLFSVRVLIDRFAVQRLARHATELRDPEWQALFRACADRVGVDGYVRLLRSSALTTPVALGIRHPAIVVPALADAWPDDMRRAVLLHELAHVARRDCLTQTAAACACAIYWMHPGSWWLARRLRIERELACDDLVLSAGTDAGDYAGHLLELAYTFRGHAPALAVGMAAPRQLEARMLAVLDRARNRTVPTRLRQAATAAVFTALIVPIAATTAVTTQTADQAGADAQPQDVRDGGPELLRRVLSVEYWRQTATEQLARLADQLNYLGEMRQLGYSVADVDVLFRLRQHGVTPEYVRSLSAQGLSGLSTDDLLIAVSHGISAGYVRDLKSLGYQPLDIKALTEMRNHGIDGDFIRDLSAVGFTRLSIDDLVRSRSHGISSDYIRELQALGYRPSLDDLILLRSHGVTPGQVQSANEQAGTRLSFGELAALASRGWKP